MGMDSSDPSSEDSSHKRPRSCSEFSSRSSSSDNKNRPPPVSYKAAVAPILEGTAGICENAPPLIFHVEDMAIADKESCPSVLFSKTLKDQLNNRWGNALIIKIMGTSFSFNYFLHKLQQRWSHLKGLWQLMDIANDCFIVRFDHLDDMEYVLCNGPWVIAGYYLALQRWKADYDPSRDKISRLHVWIRFVGLKSQWFDVAILTALGNLIGTTHKVDYRTSQLVRGQYARVCIELDITKPLVNKIEVEGVWCLIQYEGLHLVCFGCGVYGHDHAHCPKGLPKLTAEDGSNINLSTPSYCHEEAKEVLMKLEEEKKAKDALAEKEKFTQLNNWNLVTSKRQAARQRQREHHGHYNQRNNAARPPHGARPFPGTNVAMVQDKGKAPASHVKAPKPFTINSEKLSLGGNNLNVLKAKKQVDTIFGTVLVTPSSSDFPSHPPYKKFTPSLQTLTHRGTQIHAFNPPFIFQEKGKSPSSPVPLMKDKLAAVRSMGNDASKGMVVYNPADALSAMEGVEKGVNSSSSGSLSDDKLDAIRSAESELLKDAILHSSEVDATDMVGVFHPGKNVGLGKDHTIFSLIDGLVKFEKFGPDRKKISVYPRIEQPENPNSYRARKRENFRLQRERKKERKERKFAAPLLVLAAAEDVSEVAPVC